MKKLTPQNPDFASAVKELHSSVGLCANLGIELKLIEPGKIVAVMPIGDIVGQQDGFVHAGGLATIADTALGLAAYSLMAPDENCLSSSINLMLMRPSKGDSVRAEGRVIKAGRQIYYCEGEVYAIEDGNEILTLKMTATMIAKKK